MAMTLPSLPRARDLRAALPSTPSAAPRERLLSLDVFRGMTVAGMLLVNNPGDWAASYDPLEHARWHGWTPADLVFPFFLFIVGITTYLSLGARRGRGDTEDAIRAQIVRRGTLIFLFGLLINGFPYFTWGDVAGVAEPTLGQRIVDRLLHWRVMGVLQRIGIAYTIAALLTLRTTVRQQIVIVASLLVGYWIVMTMLLVPGEGTMGAALLDQPSRTMAAWVDRAVLDWSRWGLGNHLWGSSVTWDPEGVLSTVPAIGSVMLGNLAGRWLGERRPLTERLAAMSAASGLAMMAGLMWSWVFPINKSLWTSSYALFTAGVAALALSIVMWIVDFNRVRRFTTPFVVFGVTPIVALVGSGVMSRCIYSIFEVTYAGEPISLQQGIYRTLFASWLSPMNASLAFALAFVAFWYGVLLLLHRRGILLKV